MFQFGLSDEDWKLLKSIATEAVECLIFCFGCVGIFGAFCYLLSIH